jgi:hypothetical protein
MLFQRTLYVPHPCIKQHLHYTINQQMHINTIFLSRIIQQVSVASLTITRVSYKNTNNIQTIAQNV